MDVLDDDVDSLPLCQGGIIDVLNGSPDTDIAEQAVTVLMPILHLLVCILRLSAYDHDQVAMAENITSQSLTNVACCSEDDPDLLLGRIRFRGRVG